MPAPRESWLSSPSTFPGSQPNWGGMTVIHQLQTEQAAKSLIQKVCQPKIMVLVDIMA